MTLLWQERRLERGLDFTEGTAGGAASRRLSCHHNEVTSYLERGVCPKLDDMNINEYPQVPR